MVAPIVKTEGQHKGEFLVSEANGTLSRETGTLTAGQITVDGRLLKWSSGKLVVAAGTLNSAGTSDEDLAGIAVGATDASVAGPGGSVDTTIVYIARMAEVKAENVVYHVSGTNAAAKTVALKAKLRTSLQIASR